MTESEDDRAPSTAPYRVLARKYRPSRLDGLVGQEALVRTLTNAIRSGRLAHAFILTGVRGIGKTTTARIIARALNCVGPDGTGGPTPAPCGVCEHCVAIAEDRHVDVIEMDAASRTGVDEIRELIDGVRYRPINARYKVYIIDEVHMLSRNAFNALLKTLEEPPEHVRFVFATTEIRKVPVTVLSRCQRFDLRRVDAATLAEHLGGIVAEEGVSASPPALQMIARAADGSVRDGLSLLDQAIAHCGGEVGEDAVRDMLGLADRTVSFDLLDAVMRGDVPAALEVFTDQHRAGADPAMVIEDLLELVHWLTRLRVTPGTADAPGVPEAERVRGRDMAARLPMAELARAWQMLLKGLGEVRTGPLPAQAVEMVLVRLAYASSLPTPAEAVKAQTDAPAAGGPVAGPAAQAPRTPSDAGSSLPSGPPVPDARTSGPLLDDGGPVAVRVGAEADPAVDTIAEPKCFEDVVGLAEVQGELILRAHLVSDVHLVHFEPGRIEIRLGEHADRELPGRIARLLNAHTTRRWMVTVSNEPGAATLQQTAEAAEAERRAAAMRHPLVQAVLETFPGAEIENVRRHAPDGPPAQTDEPPVKDD